MIPSKVMYLLTLILMTVVSQDQFTNCVLVDELVEAGEVSHTLLQEAELLCSMNYLSLSTGCNRSINVPACEICTILLRFLHPHEIQVDATSRRRRVVGPLEDQVRPVSSHCCFKFHQHSRRPVAESLEGEVQ